jgi:hypothetical protein
MQVQKKLHLPFCCMIAVQTQTLCRCPCQLLKVDQLLHATPNLRNRQVQGSLTLLPWTENIALKASVSQQRLCGCGGSMANCSMHSGRGKIALASKNTGGKPCAQDRVSYQRSHQRWGYVPQDTCTVVLEPVAHVSVAHHKGALTFVKQADLTQLNSSG